MPDRTRMLERIEARLLDLVLLVQGGLEEHEADIAAMTNEELYQFGLRLRRLQERLEGSEEALRAAREEAAYVRRQWLRQIAPQPEPRPPFRIAPEGLWPDLPPGWRWIARWQAAHDDGTTTAVYNDPAHVMKQARKHAPVPRPPRSEAPDTLFDIDDYAAPLPGGGIKAIQGR